MAMLSTSTREFTNKILDRSDGPTDSQKDILTTLGSHLHFFSTGSRTDICFRYVIDFQ
jgi:hypothetical protein